MDVRLGRLEEWRDSKVDPHLDSHERRIDSLEASRDETKGSLRVIIWMNGIIIAMIIGMMVALFTWGLGHVTLHLV